MTKEIKKGDWFIAPYRGRRVDLLEQAVRPWPWKPHWLTRDWKGTMNASQSLLSSCRRIGPRAVAKIVAAERKRLAKLKSK